MITWEEQMKRRQLLADNLERLLLAQITGQGRASDNLLLRIIKRVRDTGKDYKGESFKGYSTKPLRLRKGMVMQIGQGTYESAMKLANWFTTKNGTKIPILEGGYKRLRQIAGRKVDHKMFDWSGMMWKDFGVREKEVANGNIKIKQSFSVRQDVANSHNEREKTNIVKASNTETKQFINEASKEFTKLMNQI